VVAFLLVSGRAAHAQSSSAGAAAQSLYDDGKALMAAGKAQEACPKFEASQRLDPGSGTLLNLALCYEKSGRLASAWNKYLEAAAMAKTSGNEQRDEAARASAAQLAPRLSKLDIEVTPDARLPGLQVLCDGEPVDAAQWGLPVPMDGGEHAVTARAPGYTEWKSTVEVGAEGDAVHVTIPVLIAAPAQATPSPVASRGAPPATPASSSGPGGHASSSGLGGQKIAAIAVGGVGVVGIAVGTVFGLRAVSKKSEAEASCTGAVCTTPEGATAGTDAHAAGNTATIGMVVGAVGLAGGALLWLTAPKGEHATQVGFGAGSVQVHGVW
jgi:hypothetical protein